MKRTHLTGLTLATLIAGGMAVTGSNTYAAASHRGHKTIKAAEANSAYIFAPKKTTIKVGTKVTWTDPTDAPHTVTSSTASWTFDKKLAVSGTVTATFKKAGTFKYHCTYHAGMTGIIVVTK